jgi:sodium/proline symporter
VSAAPASPTGVIAVVLALYLGVLLLIAWRAARRTHGGEDFHLAGRSLGAWAAGISSTASSESGWVTLGAVGMTYAFGVSGLWYAPGCLLGYLVNLYFVAPRLRELSVRQRSVTLTDVLARRWGDPHHLLRVTSVTIIVASMMTYVAAQMTAAGKALATTLGLEQHAVRLPLVGVELSLSPYAIGVLIGAAVITVVTLMGGFRSVAWTDLFQGLLMAAALIALPVYAVAVLGGFGALVHALGPISPDLLTATGGRVGPALWGFVIGELGIGLGYPGMPHVVTRYMATRNAEQLRRLRLIALLWGVAVFYGAGVVGLAGRVMLPDLADGETALMAVSLRLLHPVLAGLMLAAVASAILSTVSSQLLVAASAVSYDVVEGAMGAHPDDRRSLHLGRWTVAVVGMLGVVLALGQARVVFWFVLFAWSALGASFGPLVLLALGTDRLNRFGALAGMLTGFGVTLAWKLGREPEANAAAFGMVPWVVLLAVALLLAAGAALHFMERSDAAAVLTAGAITVAAWVAVHNPAMATVYELVPAFVLAAAAALTVSALTGSPAGVASR